MDNRDDLFRRLTERAKEQDRERAIERERELREGRSIRLGGQRACTTSGILPAAQKTSTLKTCRGATVGIAGSFLSEAQAGGGTGGGVKVDLLGEG